MRQLKTILAGLLLASCLFGVLIAPTAVAQDGVNNTTEEKAPLYEDAQQPDTDGWFAGVDMTLPGLVTMISRVSTFVIGGGGGAGVSGQLLSGVVVLGIGVGTVARANVGAVAGSVLGVTAIFAGATVGIAPQWLTAVVMFAIGLVLASVFRRVVG